jgi:hypothetical protein
MESSRSGKGIRIDADGHGSRHQIYGRLQQGIDDRGNLRRRLVCVLEANQVGSFLVDVDAGNASLQILNLPENQAPGLLLRLRIGNVVANLEDQTGVVVQRSLAAHDSLVLQSEQRIDVGVVA